MESNINPTDVLVLILALVVGISIKIYLKKTGLGKSKKVVSGMFWLKLASNFLIVAGSIGLALTGLSYYFYLQSI